MRSSHLSCGLVVAATLAVLGCGETVIDSDKAETFIKTTVTAQAGVNVKSVSCPEDPKPEKGATFTCKVTGTDNSTGDVVATQRDDKGNVGIAAPFLHVREAEASIAEQIKEQTKTTVTVQCQEVIIPKTGGTFPCQASDGKQTRKVETTMTDDQGGFRFKLL